MYFLKQFVKWITKPDKKDKTANPEDYLNRRREIFETEQQKLKKWRKEIKQLMSSNYTHSTSIGHLPGNITSNIITSTSLADSAITINGGPNGSMSFDVPLIVHGRDIMKELDEMRDALLLLKRDVDMEAKYPRLRELKDEYEQALEKYKTFETIKESK